MYGHYTTVCPRRTCNSFPLPRIISVSKHVKNLCCSGKLLQHNTPFLIYFGIRAVNRGSLGIWYRRDIAGSVPVSRVRDRAYRNQLGRGGMRFLFLTSRPPPFFILRRFVKSQIIAERERPFHRHQKHCSMLSTQYRRFRHPA